MRIAAGIGLLAMGVAGAAGVLPAMRELTYPLLWWGLLLLVDEWNFRRRGLSLWRGNAAAFFAVIVPVSTLLWLFFELLNLPRPEWVYLGGFHSIAGQTVLGFVAFATVVPIEIEAWWLVRRRIAIAGPLLDAARRWRWAFLVAGVALVALPWIQTGPWYWNQGMWIVPALLLLPFVHAERADGGRWLADLCVAGLLAGFFWEGLNWASHTHWEYTILKNAPHVFQMPLPGYVGFIPFALTCLAVYEACRTIRGSIATAVMLWALAMGLMFVVTEVYFERGIWRP